MTTYAPPRGDLDVLRTWHLPSGYRGVYRHKAGWRAYGLGRRKLGFFPDPRAAAVAVAAWWRGRYGDDWPAHFKRSRHQNLTSFLHTDFGWVAFVWEEGRRRAVPCPDRGRVAFASRAEARAYLRRWVLAQHGLFAGVAISRTVAPGGPYLRGA